MSLPDLCRLLLISARGQWLKAMLEQHTRLSDQIGRSWLGLHKRKNNECNKKTESLVLLHQLWSFLKLSIQALCYGRATRRLEEVYEMPLRAYSIFWSWQTNQQDRISKFNFSVPDQMALSQTSRSLSGKSVTQSPGRESQTNCSRRLVWLSTFQFITDRPLFK